ncbi:endoplasmic reticulum junction formation protein lunapark-B-like [Anopheles albimanus]|uniref:Endoplasmic reticulum junction formation protein lunapark n=1 Tax=Anopheles albimanus TaxID=7167 RepID=A0A182G051_ANOAL|nr:endoplasmic reticulum junction formation protein lunapark-B-like [Anopheles albimanus]
MGVIISRFRKEKTTLQILEGLEEKIKDLEAYTISTQARRKRFVGRFLVTSIVLYVVASLVFYFAFFPPTWNERIVHSVPLLICPIIIFIVKRVLAWHYERKVRLNSNKLKDLRAEKKKILEKVMEKETYKVAVEILDKFGEKSHRLQTQAFNATLNALRSPAPKPMPVGMPSPRPQGTPAGAMQRQLSPPTAGRPMGTPMTPPMIRPVNPMQTPRTAPGNFMPRASVQQPFPARQSGVYRRTPFPIINHNEKSVVEKMVDYLVGDGPTNRFAMICNECFMHNGMALKEEYEFTAFRCAFCGLFNPAKKQRPVAPRLSSEQHELDKLQQKPTSSDGSEGEEEEEDASSESSQSGESRRSPGVGEEGPVESELELQTAEARQLQTGSSSAEGGDESEQQTLDQPDSDIDGAAKPQAPSENAPEPEVPTRPETVGSKKVD